MPMFTDDEIQSAVEQIVRTSIRRPYDDTGVRRTDITFSDLTDAAAGVFVLYPNALYYTVKLATDKTRIVVTSNQDLVVSFMNYVTAVGRHVRPVESLSALANARVALEELTNASSVREAGFKSVTETSAYQRFNTNTQNFLDDVGGNVKYNGDIVPTPDEARGLFAESFKSLQEGIADVLRRVELLQNAVDDFDSMDIPSSLFGNIVSNSMTLLKSEYDKLNAKTPEERLTVIRTTVLNVLAARSTVAGFGNLSSPGMFYTLSGNGGVYASSDYPAVHASVTGDQYGPFNILGTANELDIRLDGDTAITTTVRVQPSFVPFIEATVKEPYIITDGVLPGEVDNRYLSFGLKNYPTVGSQTIIDHYLASPVTYDAYQVCESMNSYISLMPGNVPLLAEPYCNPLRWTGNVDITITGAVITFTAVNPAAVDFVALGVQEGDSIIVRDVTASGDRAVYTVNTLGVYADHLDCSLMHGTYYAETNKTIQVGSGRLAIRLRITDHTDSNISKPDYRLQALEDRVSIYIPEVGAFTKDQQFYGSTVLGFYPVMDAVARPTPASEVVLTFNAQPGAAVNGVARVMASAVFDPITFEGMGRTNPYDPLMFVAYKYKATCDMSDGGTTIVFNCTGAATAGVVVGDTLVIRSSVTPGVVNYPFVVSAVDDASITVAGTIASGETGVGIEVGPTFTSAEALDAALIVTGNTANDGEYVVRSNNTIPFELTVDRRIPVAAGIGNLPVACTLALGRHVIKFESLKEDLTTQIYMSSESNPASAFFKFFGAAPQEDYGETYYYKPPSLPKGVGEGDMLELYTTELSPSYVGVIQQVDATLGVLRLDVALPVNTASMPFDSGSPLPFARIRRLHTDNYDVFSKALVGWLNAYDFTQLFMDLMRALNVLLVNTNPTAVQVNDAKARLQDIDDALTTLQPILIAYTATVSPQLDELVKSYKEKGATRAADILLECRFSEFFGLTQEELSYASYVQKSIKDVQNNDLPIRKFDRDGKYRMEQALVGSWDEQDFEFSKGDADPEPMLDTPGSPDFMLPSR